MDYQKNNISFRIVSSEAIARLKSNQASALKQMLRNELNFDSGAKECVLLFFHQFSAWTLDLEKICLRVPHGQSLNALNDAIVDSFGREMKFILNTMKKYPDVFSKTLHDYVEMVQAYSLKIFLKHFEKYLQGNAVLAFSRICDFVSIFLQHMLVALHEFSNNIVCKKEAPFLSTTNFSIHPVNAEYIYVPCTERAKFFVDQGCGSSFVLKNYTDDRGAYLPISTLLQKNNIDIKPEPPQNLRNDMHT